MALRLVGAIDAEIKYAIPEGGVTTRAAMLGKTQAGTLSGELLRSGAQYKGFVGSVAIFHGWRAIDMMMGQQGVIAKGRYLIALGIEATVLGALSYQLKNIVAGRDPEAMDTWSFGRRRPWAAPAACSAICSRPPSRPSRRQTSTRSPVTHCWPDR